MAEERTLDRLGHMLEAIEAIERLCAGKGFADFQRNPDLVAAVERYIVRLSEASRHLPDARKRAFPEIDWRGAADIGNVLRHAYDQVMDEQVWQVVTEDLTPLKRAVQAMIEKLKHETDDRHMDLGSACQVIVEPLSAG